MLGVRGETKARRTPLAGYSHGEYNLTSIEELRQSRRTIPSPPTYGAPA